MLHLGLCFRGTVPLLACLCVACTAFIPVQTTFPYRGHQAASSARPSTTIGGPGSPTQQATTPTAGTQRRPISVSCRGEGAGDEGVEIAVDRAAAAGAAAAATSAEVDPFRPTRASMSPLVINALVSVLFRPDTEATGAAAAALERRSDWEFTEEEERAVTSRVCGVASHLTELRFMLATAVERTPSIAKYGMFSDYGMSENVENDPLAQMNQAECLLALYILHKENAGGAAVDFLDAERLDVLQG
ncbi:unnamed protein product [Ectocarpus sp. 12 AP-2014]